MGDAAGGDLFFPQQAKTQLQAPNPTTEWTQRQAGPDFFKDGENVLFFRAARAQHCEFRSANNTLRLCVETDHFVRRTAQTHDSVMHQFIDVPASDIIERRRISFEIGFFTEHTFRVRFAAHEKILDNLTDNPSFPPPEARMLVEPEQKVQTQFRQSQPEDSCTLSTDSVRIHVNFKPFQLSAFRVDSNRLFWRQRLSDLFTGDVIPTSIAEHEGRRATFEAFQLHPGEQLYGLGERFDAVSRRGRPVDFINHDAIGTSNTRSYINVPFFWTTRGYGCFVNSYARTEWDMGMSETGTVGFCTEDNHMDYFIISGPSPKDIISRYTRHLTGVSPVPPTWTFGLWLSRNSYQSWAVVDAVLTKCAEHRIPVDDIHLDTSWFKEDWNPDLIFDTVRFADHENKMHALKRDGVHVSLWQYTFAPPRNDNSLFVEGKQQGYFGLAKNPDGTPSKNLFKYPPNSSGWKIDDAVIDYSNPSAREWYSAKISSLISQGASAIKTDFGDCIPPDAHYRNIAGRKFQNLYSLVYNATVTRAIQSVNKDTIVWARSGTAGSQRYPIHWGGDSQCSWAGLQGSLYATLSMGLSGFSFFATDTGGFIGAPSAELYVRWAQLSLFGASHARCHGAGDENAREPWAFGPLALRVFRTFVDLRYRLLPYIVQQSREGAELGLPLVRHLVLEWPEDRSVWGIECQYMFGREILVAPVVVAMEEMGAKMDVYFPKGRWWDFWSKEVVLESSGEWREVDVPGLESMAMWVRDGAVLAFAEEGRLRTWNRVGRVVKVECYGKPSGRGMWECGDGEEGKIVVVEHGSGEWVVEGREGEVDVRVYE